MMFSLIIQAIVQGLTEFFPVSSSGHLLFLQTLYPLKHIDNLFIDVFLHSATFLVIIIYYFKDIVKILTNFFKSPFNLSNQDTKLGWLIIAGSIPTGIIGIIIMKFFSSIFYKANILFFTWSLTALFLIISDKIKNSKKDIYDITLKDALLIGLIQGIAIFPGISRSGSTIITALFLKVKRNAAAKFSFLLGLPAMLAGILIELKDIKNVMLQPSFIWIFVITFISGLIGLLLLIKLLKNAKFKYFGIYLIILIILLTLKTL